MARTKISEFSATPGDNTDIDGIDIAEGCAPSGINNAIRELMAQLKDMQTGASGDTFTLTTVNSTTVDTTNLEATNLKAKDGTAAGSIANSTGVVTLGSSVLTTTDINGGTVDGTTIGATTPSTVVATQVDITAQGDLRLQDTTGGQYVALQAPGTIATSYTLTLPVDDGTSGQALITDGSGVLSWSTAASGDVYGPASATDNAVARYDGTTGKIIQNSAVTIADDGATVIAANSTSDGLRITQIGSGNALLVEDSANPDATPFVVTAAGKVGVNVASPSIFGDSGIQMQSESSTGAVGFYLRRAEDSGGSASLISFDKLRGTFNSPTAAQNADTLGYLFFRGYDGAGNISAASITAAVDGTPGTNDMPGRLLFSTTADGASSPTERMRIDNAGRVGIGGTPYAGSSVIFAKNITGSSQAYAVSSEGTIQSDVTGTARLFYTAAKTAAASFTTSVLNHYTADQGTFGAGSAVTNQRGFAVESTLTGATNNYGFYGNIASGTGRWNFYAAGTAANYFAGNVGIGTTAPGAPLEVTGTSASMVVRATAAGQGSYVIAAASDYFSTPSYRGALLLQYNASATGTSLGLNNTNLGVLSFQNSSSGAIFTSGSNVLRIGTFSTTAISIATNQVISLGAAPGAESLRVTPVASAVNYFNAQGSATGNTPALSVQGSDANIQFAASSKGTAALNFFTNAFGQQQFAIAHTASAVNYLQVVGNVTGSGPVLSSQGSDTNINIGYVTKGTGLHAFATNTTAVQFQIAHTASAVNYLQVTGGATGGPPVITAQGSDTNISLYVKAKGTGFVVNQSNTATYFQNLSGATQFIVGSVASSVNYINAAGGATGNAPGLYAQGTDTNVDLALVPQGTGRVRFGTLTATSDVAITGYIEIKDSAGNVRKLAVIT
jgi:hypothetical protein